MITKSGSAKWQGGLKDGQGEISTQSGALSGQPYGFNTRFEDKPGTNPEELIGAAHASCFSMAFAKILAEKDVRDVKIESKSEISMEKSGDGFKITTAALTSSVSANGERSVIEECANNAKDGCPVSKLLNADVTLDLTIS